MITAALVVLGIAGACFTFRLVRGPGLADRVVAMDGLLVVGVSAIAVGSVRTGTTAFLPALLVVTLVSFVSTAVIARFIEGRSS